MRPYVRKERKLHLFKEQEIIESFFYVKSQLEKMIEEENVIVLFVGTSPHLSEIVKQAAISCQSPYLANYWPGGFLTNFRTIRQQIKHLKDLLYFQKSEKFASLSKKRQAELEKEITKLKEVYEGVLDLLKYDCLFTSPREEKRSKILLFIIGLKKEKTALKEAKSLNIPVIAICNTDGDPDLIDYLILGNDYTESSVAFLIDKVAEIIRESKLKKDAGLSTEKAAVAAANEEKVLSTEAH
ncbi:8225_t:CDS:1 [Racocetra persica]|uniref:8225_t:CDS:1 n=1 Tax=Racocetra persica TaxID=160502 RepID=A0ACA9RQB8_9GLOM|nr:8225_t:CDS:1 [Racocetra persica]